MIISIISCWFRVGWCCSACIRRRVIAGNVRILWEITRLWLIIHHQGDCSVSDKGPCNHITILSGQIYVPVHFILNMQVSDFKPMMLSLLMLQIASMLILMGDTPHASILGSSCPRSSSRGSSSCTANCATSFSSQYAHWDSSWLWCAEWSAWSRERHPLSDRNIKNPDGVDPAVESIIISCRPQFILMIMYLSTIREVM